MLSLALNLPTTAELLAIDTQQLQQFIQRDQSTGILRLAENEWRVSLFTIARWLDTTPEMLLTLLEDTAFTEILIEADEEDAMSFEEGFAFYQTQLAQ